MINELHSLTQALIQAGIKLEYTHLKYKPIPNVTKKAPCFHIILDHGCIDAVEYIEEKQAKKLGNSGQIREHFLQ